MYYIDGYAHKYQKINGFEALVNTKEGIKKAFISMKPTTRAAYDLSMRENTIDGLITMDEIEKLKSGYTYTIKQDPDNIYFIQTLSLWETQLISRNFNAIRCNCKVTVQRKIYDEELCEYIWTDVYKDVCASVSHTLTDSKNFNAGVENATYKVIQMPIWEFIKDEEDNILEEKVRQVKINDRIVLKSIISDDLEEEIVVESVDNFGISGTIKVQGTADMR